MKNTLDYVCPACRANLKFNPHGQNWVCEYCGNAFNLDELKDQEEKLTKDTKAVKMEQDEHGMDIYSCH